MIQQLNEILDNYISYKDRFKSFLHDMLSPYACSYVMKETDKSLIAFIKAPNGDRIAILKYNKYKGTVKRVDKGTGGHDAIINALKNTYGDLMNISRKNK